MPEINNVLVRAPLLDTQQRIIGYALAWQQAELDACRAVAADPSTLAGLVAETINEPVGWRLGDQVLFLEAAPTLIMSGVLASLPGNNIVLVITTEDGVEADTVAALHTLRQQGFGVCLRWTGQAEPDKALFSLLTHIELVFSRTDFTVFGRQYALIKQLPLQKVVRNLVSWQDYDTCVALGFDVLSGLFHLMPRPGSASKGLNTSQVLIVQLLDMVRKNADARQIEQVLKRDPVVSYKLLRYINSAGFGLGCEIESLRHAVQVLGYTPLYRWLSVLLATAGTSQSAQLLMQTAIIRARLAELFGDTFLPKAGTDDLFVAGLFSLLDRLLGIPMAAVLDKIQLPDVMAQALLTREGLYGDFLALAEACEQGAGCAGRLAASLQLDAVQLSQKHLSALAWAKNMDA
jgi:EAL and modified HD-GYP domain-containing signal transduction protein